MRFATFIALATTSLAVVLPSRRDVGGCVINLTSVVPNAGQFIAEASVLSLFFDTDPNYVPINTGNLASSIISNTEYTVTIIPDASQGFDDAFVIAVVSKWTGLYLDTGTTTASTESGAEDFLVTNVSCT
ncbi:hypothetical protein FIBSPDRAFT_869524 [Athelia psychrophila]|uniref:Uncharacterized protein n=1 Tax=Athelia psychrophila TaxID=1759441 RepID=A0A166C2J6_9AGAM|nr:hypothetical protein FIBSPDRAFT_869524 [Fibularhizoctonia sp. CBS 109695]